MIFFFLTFIFTKKKYKKIKNSFFERGFNRLGKNIFSINIHFFCLVIIFVLFDLELFFFLFVFFNYYLVY